MQHIYLLVFRKQKSKAKFNILDEVRVGGSGNREAEPKNFVQSNNPEELGWSGNRAEKPAPQRKIQLQL